MKSNRKYVMRTVPFGRAVSAGLKMAVLLWCLMVAQVARAQAPSYTITDLGTLGGSSGASDINDSGQVVGSFATGDYGGGHAFLYSGGVMHDLGTLGGGNSSAEGINDNGQVVGNTGESRAFLYSGGVMQDLGTLGGTNSFADDISSNGEVVGSSFLSGGVFNIPDGPSTQHGFLYSGGVMQDLGTMGGTGSAATGINASGQIAGYSFIAGDSSYHAVLYSGGMWKDLGTLGGGLSSANAINSNGQVVGYSDMPGEAYVQHAFLYSDDTIRDLGTLGGTYSEALGINASGQVVGRSDIISNIGKHAFLYSKGEMLDLNTLLPPNSGWILIDASAINDKGQIVGTGYHNGQQRAFLMTPNGPVAQNDRKIILIKGTWNASSYEGTGNLKERLKSELGYKEENILVTDLSPAKFPLVGGMQSIKNSVKYIHDQILAWKRSHPEWGNDSKPLEVDIIAHSAGGLAARYFISKENYVDPPGNVRVLCKVRNLITLGTPLGGIWATQTLSRQLTGTVLDDMQPVFTNNNPVYKDFGSTKYWELGGNTRYPEIAAYDLGDWLYRITSVTEPEKFDGLVNVKSVRGLWPGRELNSPCLPQYRIIDGVNHRNLPKDDNVVSNYIFPVLRGEQWESCGTGGGGSFRMFAKAATTSDPSQLLETKNVALTQNVLQSSSVPIDSASEVSFSATTKATGTFNIQKPDGSSITPAEADGTDIIYQAGTDTGLNVNWYIYTIKNPASGTWTLQFTPTDVPTDGNTASLIIAVKNDLHLEGATDKTEYSNGATPQLTATLTENSDALTGATVGAALTKQGGGTPINVVLLDDGAHNDGAANDGVYGGSPAAMTEGGIYDIRFQANGSNAAREAFQRVDFGFFTIAPESASLSKTYTDAGVDDDSDTVFEHLQVNVGVNVIEAGDYIVEADLKDSEGNLIDSAIGSARELASGARTVSLLFDGETILKHGKAGPFKVDNIRLYADTDTRPIWIETDADGCTTESYTLAQFDHPPSVVVLQPDATNPTAGNSFDVVLQATDEDTLAKVSVYYDTDNSGNDGTLIAADLAADGEHTVTWDTSAVPAGSYYIYAVASDDIRPDVTSYSLGVVQVQPQGQNTSPVLGEIGDQSVTEGAELSFTASASDEDDDALTYSLAAGADAVPEGATIDAATGEFTWTPGQDQGPGEYSFKIVVTDDGGVGNTEPLLSDEEEITVTVAEDNHPPILTSPGDQNVESGSNLAFTLEATDEDEGQTLTYSATGLPIGATLDPKTGVFSWTPTANQLGTYTVTLTVSDGNSGGEDSKTITITVTKPNSAPVLPFVGARTLKYGSTTAFNFAATDADGDTLTYSLVGAPTGAAIDSSTGKFSWTPTADQSNNTFYSFKVRVSDNGTPSLSDEATAAFTVQRPNVNTAPVLSFVGARTLYFGRTNTFNFAAADSDVPKDTLTYSLINAPVGASIDSAGVFTWTPTAAQANLSNNFYSFKIKVTDDGFPAKSNEAIASFTVQYPAQISVDPTHPSAKADNASKSVTFVYTVRNNTSVAQSNLRVQGDVFWPTALQSVTLTSAWRTTATQSNLTASSKRIVWNISSLPAGTSRTLTVRLTGVVPMNAAQKSRIASGFVLSPVSGTAFPNHTSPEVFLNTFK